MKKKYVSAMVLAAVLGMQAFAGNVQAAGQKTEKLTYEDFNAYTKSTPTAGVVEGQDKESTLKNGTVEYKNESDGTVYGILATDGAKITANQENITITAKNTGSGYTAGVSGDLLKQTYKKGNQDPDGNSISEDYTKYTDAGHVVLGEAGVTKNITINAISAGSDAVGLEVLRNVNSTASTSTDVAAAPGSIVVNGDNLTINAQSQNGMAAGIWVQNNTGDSNNPSTVIINAENTQMDLHSEKGETTGIVAYSGGHVNIESNLKIEADNVILTRGGSTIDINKNKQHSTQLIGDVTFDYDQTTSGTPINANVNMNLTGADSIWIGNTRANWTAEDTKPSEDTMKVTDFHLLLQDGAQWTVNTVAEMEEEVENPNGPDLSGSSYIAADEVTLNGGIINITGKQDQGENIHTGVTIEKLNGTGGTVNLEADENFTTRQLEILSAGNKEESGATPTALSVNFTGINADDIKDAEKAMTSLASNVKFGTSGQGITGNTVTATANVAEGLISGAITAEMDTTGASSTTGGIKTETVKQNSSTSTMDNMRDIAAVSIAAWRQEDSTLSQRLGDLRESKEGQGIWARMNRGEFEYSGAFKNQYNYFQIGYDMAKDDWHYGAAISYNDGETSYASGYGENSSTSLSLYGTRLLNDGQYFDIVLKAGRLSNEYDNYADAGHTHGDYDAWGTAVSGEYGKKIDLANDWFVTPQAQLSLMRIGGEDYTTSNGIAVSQDTLYSAVGRVGFEAGKDTGWGSLYAKASVLHEFAGDADTYVRRGDQSNSYSQDLGDTWYEAGFGFNWKMGNGSYFYADVIRTFGGDIETPWQWNAGVRWGF